MTSLPFWHKHALMGVHKITAILHHELWEVTAISSRTPSIINFLHLSPAAPQWRQATQGVTHHDVMAWKCFPHYWPFVRGIHRSPVDSPHKGPVMERFDRHKFHDQLFFVVIYILYIDGFVVPYFVVVLCLIDSCDALIHILQSPFQYEDHNGKTLIRLSYLYNRNFYAGNTSSLHWNASRGPSQYKDVTLPV